MTTNNETSATITSTRTYRTATTTELAGVVGGMSVAIRVMTNSAAGRGADVEVIDRRNRHANQYGAIATFDAGPDGDLTLIEGDETYEDAARAILTCAVQEGLVSL